VLPGKTAYDGCHKMHVKCSLWLQSSTRVLQVKAYRIAEVMAELGQESAGTHWPVSRVSSQRRQVDSHTSELMPQEILYLKEKQLGLVNT
jgi:hypothetical protein